MQRVKSIGVLSFAKISGVCYGILGLLIAPFFLLMGLISGFGGRSGGRVGPGLGPVFGVGLAILMPLIYGVMGFVLGAIGSFIYNAVASWLGGIEVDLEPSPQTAAAVSSMPQPS